MEIRTQTPIQHTSIDWIWTTKILLIILVTIKLMKMMHKRPNELERLVCKISMPYYEIYHGLSEEDKDLLTVTIRNTLENRTTVPSYSRITYRRNKKSVSFDM